MPGQGDPGAVVMHVDITDRRRAEEGLRKLSTAVEQSPVSIAITDTTGRIEYVNPFLMQTLGYTAAEVIGANPRLWKGGATPAEVYEELWQTITSGRIWQGTIQNRKKNGELIWEHARIAPLRNPEGVITHYVAVKEDITEARRRDEALQAVQAQLQHVTASSAAVIYVLRVEGGHHIRTWVSPNIKRVLGYEVEEALVAGWWRERVQPEDLEQARASEQQFQSRQEMSREYRFRHGDGSYRWILDESRRTTGEQGAVEVVGSWLDITERKHLELQFRQSQKMEAVGRLTGGIAHDFNNILMAILGYSDFLLEGLRASPRLAEDAREIRRAADRAATLTRQLLAFSRTQVLVPQPLNLNVVITDLEKLLRRLLGEDIELRTGDRHGARGSGAGRAGGHEPGAQRPGRHAQGRAAGDSHLDGGSRCQLRPGTSLCDGGPVRRHLGDRSRNRNLQGGAVPPLRAVLHHQGAGEGHRTRPGHRLRDRQAERRPHRGLQRARAGEHLQGIPPRGGATGGAAGSRPEPGGAWRTRDGAGGG
jgi:PAS domain S-box-containing protein